MIRALVIKELRESLPLVALAGLGIAYALATLSGWSFYSTAQQTASYLTPFVNTGFITIMPVVCGLFAAILGLKQAAWEDLRGTYHFLLFRPLPRARVVHTKLVVGLVLTLLVGAAMILLHGLWAATPGKHGSPFYWSMTADAWQVWAVLPIVYVAAFLSGLRPGLWWGTRLAPLVPGAVLAALLALQPWWWLAAVGSIALTALYTACIQGVAADRDY